MKIGEFYSILCEYAPIELSDKLCEVESGYDNSGVIIGFDENKELSGVLFTLDLSDGAVKKAIENNCNLIVTHHPAIYSPIKEIEFNSPLFECIHSGIGVVSMHLNFDCAKFGIDYYFALGLGAKSQKIIEDLGNNTGYGRISDVEPLTLGELLKRYKGEFKTESVVLYGDENAKISKIGTFCGSGLDEKAIKEALACGAQVVASADIKHHILLTAINSGLNVLSCTHYACENYGMKKICENFAKKYNKEKIIYFDDERLS